MLNNHAEGLRVRYSLAMANEFVYLASLSPRRRELLAQIGVPFRTVTSAVDETPLAAEAAADYVVRLAVAKAEAGRAVLAAAGAVAAPVLGADTAVVLDDRILGKPADTDDAAGMLQRLSGRTHEVLTAVALTGAESPEWRLSRSAVTFRAIEPAEAAAYARSGEALDKAGGYAIQGFAAVFVDHLVGSYSGVMGLPLCETAELLAAAGVPRWCTV